MLTVLPAANCSGPRPLGNLIEPNDMPRVVLGCHSTCITSDCSEPLGFALTYCDVTLPAFRSAASVVVRSGSAGVAILSEFRTAFRAVTLAPRALRELIACVKGTMEATTVLAKFTACGMSLRPALVAAPD